MYKQGGAVVPGQCRDPGSNPANPRDWDRNRDSKPQDARDRDKNLRDNKSRHIGTKIPLSPGTVLLSWDFMERESRIVLGFNLTHFSDYSSF